MRLLYTPSVQASDRLPTAVSVYTGWGKGKTIHPKTKGLERRKKPTQEQSISTVQTKQQHREQGKRCEGGDTQTKTPVPSRHCLPEPPQQAAPMSHSTSTCALPQWGPGAEPSAGDMQQRPAEADSGEPPSGQLGKIKPSRKMRHQQSQQIPTAHSHLLGESSCPTHSPWGSQGIRHHHTGTLPCWHKLKESRAAVGKQHESTQGLRYLSGKGDESKKRHRHQDEGYQELALVQAPV